MKNLIIELYKFLFLRPCARKLNQLVFQCAAHGLGILNYKTSHDNGEAYLVNKFLCEYFAGKTDITFFDVGANVGDYSRLLCDAFPGAKVYAFEPHPDTYNELSGHGKSVPYEPVNFGMSETPGETVIYEKANNSVSQHNSLYKTVIANSNEAEPRAVEINLTSVDAFMQERGIERIDFLKIDTEGHELSILKGARKAISKGQIELVQFEFNEMNLHSHTTMRDLRATLPNYTFYRLSPRGLVLLPDLSLYQEIYQFNNILCVPNKRNLPM